MSAPIPSPTAHDLLDDSATYERLDPGGMADLVAGLPEMGHEVWQSAMRLRLPELAEVTAVLVIGMGGSGVGGDLLQALLAPTVPVPVITLKDSQIPAFVGPRTLVFACSYSGETVETLQACEQAKAVGAPVIVITSGGSLAERARTAGDPLVILPAGIPQRAAVAYLFLPMVSAIRRWTHLEELSGEWAEARQVLTGLSRELRRETPAAVNPAKRLARGLVDRIPAVYASSPALAAAAYRWKCQINENAKTLALWGALPELAHNEVVGWEDQWLAAHVAVVLLRDPEESKQDAVARRLTAAREVAFKHAASVDDVYARGRSMLARLLSLVLFGDFVSVYLALLRGVDPVPVASITEIKRRISS